MTDLFHDKAADWDTRPIPTQITEGVMRALRDAVTFGPDTQVMDFGAGTGLVCEKLAPEVAHVLAVDISSAMLDKLTAKPALEGKVTALCQDIMAVPIEKDVDLIVSAMALHHVEDTRALAAAFFKLLKPGGKIALADLDAEDGTFHPPGTEGVFHDGFAREALGQQLTEARFNDVAFTTACEVDRDSGRYPVFLVSATRP